MDNCRTEIDRKSNASGITGIAAITRSLIEHGFPSYSDLDVFDHESLACLLKTGEIPQGCSPIVDIDAAVQHARDLGYDVPARHQSKEIVEAQDNASAAASFLMARRFSAEITYVTSRFVVPDPLESRKTAWFLDQLWITRDEYRPDRVRLLGLQIGDDLAGGPEDRRRDALLGTAGYEIVRASSSWSRIDPLRVLLAFATNRGIAVLRQFELPSPGRTIKDYRCAQCNGPTIRTASREGMVFHENQAFHEECFNDYVGVL